MASKPKFLPVYVIEFALKFLWCYTLISSSLAGGDFAKLAGGFQGLARQESFHAADDNHLSDDSRSVGSAITDSGLSPFAALHGPVVLSGGMQFALSSFYLLPTYRASSRHFALHRTSLFHRAILIRI